MRCYWELGEQFGNLMGTPSFTISSTKGLLAAVLPCVFPASPTTAPTRVAWRRLQEKRKLHDPACLMRHGRQSQSRQRLLDGEAKERLSLQIRFTFAVISSSSASHFFCDPVWIPPNIQVCSLGYFQKALIGVSPSFVFFKRSLVSSFSSLSLFNNNNFLKTSFKLSSNQGTWNSTGIHPLPVQQNHLFVCQEQ